MPRIEWTDELCIGIPVIDGQHKRIVDYINELHDAGATAPAATTGRIIDDLIEYTYSHFAFEESLMEEAGYDALPVHSKTHDAFRTRVDAIKARHLAGEDVAAELAELLQTWLIRHILNDDDSYAGLVKQKMPRIEGQQDGSWIGNAIKRFFG
jgi:hemerythrin